MIVAPSVLAALFSMPSCSGVDHRILNGLVRTESSGNPYAIHDDTDERSYFPNDRSSAAAIVVRLSNERHAFSVGLTQVESTTWTRYGVNGVQLLDPRTNVSVGCEVFQAHLYALRAYNTGTEAASAAGDRYAENVLTASSAVPAISPRAKVKLRSSVAAPEEFGFSVREPFTMPSFLKGAKP